LAYFIGDPPGVGESYALHW